MNERQMALIRKDVNAFTLNKQIVIMMFAVPFVLAVFIPSVFILTSYFSPGSLKDVEPLLKMLPEYTEGATDIKLFIKAIINNIMPEFILMIPVMASSVMAASSFVGEKEKHTLETLLYSPMTLTEIFSAKIMACFTVAMTVTLFSFIAMITVSELETVFITGSMMMPGFTWLIVLFIITPSVSLIAIALTVRISAKAKTFEEAQQKTVFLIMPLVLLMVGQLTGVLLINGWIMLAVGVVTAVIAGYTMKGISSRFTYETILR